MVKGDKILLKNLAVFQVSVLIVFSFAFAFIIQSSFVSGAELFFKGAGKTQTPAPTSAVSRTAFSGADMSWGLRGNLDLTKSGLDNNFDMTKVTNYQLNPDGTSRIFSEGKWNNLVAEDTKTVNEIFSKGGVTPTIGQNYKIGGYVDTGLVQGSAGAHLVQGLVWAAVVYGVAKMAGGLLGLDNKNSNSLGLAGAAGVLAYKGALALFGKGVQSTTFGKSGALIKGVLSNTQAALIGVAVAVVVFIALYKKEKKQLITFQCMPWEPPIGGASCEKCNLDPFRPCSEYRCKSLGQACELLNVGSEEERCEWVNPKDVVSPTIQPWNQALKPSARLIYTPDTTIRPPNRGVKIIGEGQDGCLQAFTPLEFGITLDEPAQCKLDWNRNATFEEMQYYFGDSNYFRYNHTQKMRLPAPNAEDQDIAPLLVNDGQFNLFARCQDANGNVNVDAFVFSFCVDPSPDTTPPIIEETSIVNNGAVQYNVDAVPISVYVNEPSDCKWSRQDKSYDDMENIMSCGSESYQVNSDLQYTCLGNLTGIKNNENNKFFFRCKDQPGVEEGKRNVNVESYGLNLRGSQPLNIIDVEPNGTISQSTSSAQVILEVRTDDGVEEGKAICAFSPSGEEGTYITMFESNNFVHRQELDLIGSEEGIEYNYRFRCVDAGGNSAEADTVFKVITDKTAPSVTRAYQDVDALKIVTNEDAICTYSLQDCNYVFNEGLPMLQANPSIKNQHFVKWEPNNKYYIKCKDEKGNEPSPNQCSIILNTIDK